MVTANTSGFDPEADYYEYWEASISDPALAEVADDPEDYDEFLELLKTGKYPLPQART